MDASHEHGAGVSASTASIVLYAAGVLICLTSLTIPNLTDGQVHGRELVRLSTIATGTLFVLVGVVIPRSRRRYIGLALGGVLVVLLALSASSLPGLKAQQDRHNAMSRDIRLIGAIEDGDIAMLKKLQSAGKNLRVWEVPESADNYLRSPDPVTHVRRLLATGQNRTDEEKQRLKEVLALLTEGTDNEESATRPDPGRSD